MGVNEEEGIIGEELLYAPRVGCVVAEVESRSDAAQSLSLKRCDDTARSCVKSIPEPLLEWGSVVATIGVSYRARYADGYAHGTKLRCRRAVLHAYICISP